MFRRGCFVVDRECECIVKNLQNGIAIVAKIDPQERKRIVLCTKTESFGSPLSDGGTEFDGPRLSDGLLYNDPLLRVFVAAIAEHRGLL